MSVTDHSNCTSAFSVTQTDQRRPETAEAPIIPQIRALTAICNAAEFDTASASLPLIDRRIFGDATDQAVLRFSEGLGPISEVRQDWVMCFDLAFDSKNKFMIKAFKAVDLESPKKWLSKKEATSFDMDNMYVDLNPDLALQADISPSLLTVKGAPDILIDRCTDIIGPDGEPTPFTEVTSAAVKQLKDQWSSDGKRVILLTRKVISKPSIMANPHSTEYEVQMMREAKFGLTLVGLIGMIDPPRSEIPEVMRTLRRAHIRVFMVSVS
jgi:sodium/potassium-transporting ATPase subunit alpha